MDRDNVKTVILNIKRINAQKGIVKSYSFCNPPMRGADSIKDAGDSKSSISKPRDIIPIRPISRYEFAPAKIEIMQSTQPNQLSNASRHEDAGGVFAARLDENYNVDTASLQGPLTLLPHQVRVTRCEVNRAKKNLKIPETISEEVEIEEPDDVINDQIPKTSCCVLSCSCLKKLISRKSAKIAISNNNLSASLAIATDLSDEVQTDREKDDNDREEVTV